MNQPHKLAYLLTALVVLPVFTLGLVGLHTIKSDLTNYQLKEISQAAQKLTHLDTQTNQQLLDLRHSLRKDVETVHSKGEWSLRCTFQKSCHANKIKRFTLIVSFDAYGDQTYPSLESTSQIYPEVIALKTISPSIKTAIKHLNKLPLSQRKSGVWSNYLTSQGHNLLYCWLGKNNYTFCSALERDWLIAEVTKVLSKTIAEQNLNHIRLVDIHQNILWQNRTPITNNIAAQKQLSAPLYFWRLEVMQNKPHAIDKYPLTLVALTLPIAALLIFIALTLFRNQKRILAEANSRANFAASISHELRTPLTNLQLYADLILSKVKNAPNQPSNEITKYTQIIAAETTRLSELVNNALTISRGNHPSLRQKFPAIPDHVIEETVSRLGPLLKDQKDKITYALQTPNEVLIDRSALEQILVNLIDNARKYANGQRILISSKIDGNKFTLTVRDWGPVISKGHLKSIFIPFSQSEEQSDKQEGFGLGLMVCQQLAKENKGTIKAEPANPGARFIVTLEISPGKNHTA